MRKRVEYDKKAMSNYGYKQVPLKQILNLDLSSEEMMILLNFFSNSDDWTIGTKGITERSFYREKNKKRVGTIMKKLKAMGYVKETETSFIVSIFKIQQDFLKNTNGVTLDNPKDVIDSTPVGITESNPVGVIESNPEKGIESNLNNMNKEKERETKRTKQTSGFGSLSPDLSEENKDVMSIPTVIENDLQLVLDNNSHFNSIYYNNEWKTYDISKYSNVFIAFAVKEKLDNNPYEGIPSKIYYLLVKLVEYSKDVNDSKLYQLFTNECSDRPDLINKLLSA